MLLQPEAVRRPQRRCGQRAVEMGMEPPGQIAAKIAGKAPIWPLPTV